MDGNLSYYLSQCRVGMKVRRLTVSRNFGKERDMENNGWVIILLYYFENHWIKEKKVEIPSIYKKGKYKVQIEWNLQLLVKSKGEKVLFFRLTVSRTDLEAEYRESCGWVHNF